jgi:hypothetical protein
VTSKDSGQNRKTINDINFYSKKSDALGERVNTFIMLHTKEFKIAFKILIYKFQNSEFVVLFLDPKFIVIYHKISRKLQFFRRKFRFLFLLVLARIGCSKFKRVSFDFIQNSYRSITLLIKKLSLCKKVPI